MFAQLIIRILFVVVAFIVVYKTFMYLFFKPEPKPETELQHSARLRLKKVKLEQEMERLESMEDEVDVTKKMNDISGRLRNVSEELAKLEEV